METLDTLLDRIRAYLPNANTDTIRRAHDFAAGVHRGVCRRSGEPFIAHPLAVAHIAAELRLDESALVAALLHDCLEDSTLTEADVEREFGPEVAKIVGGLTKLARIQFHSRQQQQAENYRKMIVAMAADLRVLLVKLCDRVHNMRTLDALPPEKQTENAQETKDIFAPLANRLGIQWVKVELEDRAFRYLMPAEYFALEGRFDETHAQREAYAADVVERIRELLADQGLGDFEVKGRPKHLWSIYRKMQVQQVDLDRVYDVIAFRVLVERKVQCYEVLAHIHSAFRPIPTRFKDYIANPKPNGYKSLHTSVYGPGNQPVEVQVRTFEMHTEAENGIAAHWKYKEGRGLSMRDEQRFHWLKRLVEMQRDVTDPNEFLDSVRYDLFEDEVYVFTPVGDVRVFPRGATTIDFAYAVHSKVGERCRGAKVNGQLVPLSYELKNGDTVEILTGTAIRTNKDWLKLAKTPAARHRIQAFVRQEQRQLSMQLGRNLLEREFRRVGKSFQRIIRAGEAESAFKHFKVENVDELCVKVGSQRLAADEVVAHVLGRDAAALPEAPPPLPEPTTSRRGSRAEATVRIDGIDDLMVRFARCCSPLPGEAIVGFVTRGRGITVHAERCGHAASLDRGRFIEVSWDGAARSARPAGVRVRCVDRAGLLAQMTETISKFGVNISGAQVQTHPDRTATCQFSLRVDDQAQLRSLMDTLDALDGVLSVERLRG